MDGWNMRTEKTVIWLPLNGVFCKKLRLFRSRLLNDSCFRQNKNLNVLSVLFALTKQFFECIYSVFPDGKHWICVSHQGTQFLSCGPCFWEDWAADSKAQYNPHSRGELWHFEEPWTCLCLWPGPASLWFQEANTDFCKATEVIQAQWCYNGGTEE